MTVEQKSVKNAAISVFIGGLISRAVGFLGSIALARILVPADYGYWVIVTMITSFFSLVIDAGFEYYYIVKVNINKGEETPQEEVVKIENSVFFLRVIVNMALFVLQFGLSYLPIELLSSPVDKIIRLLAFVHIINVMGRINEVRLKKYFNFNIITKFNVVGSIISIVTQILCALLGMGVMSFAWGTIAQTMVINIGLISIGRFHPDIKKVSRPVIKNVFKFAFHTWSGCVGQYLQSQIDKFLLKKNFTMTKVGYYSFSSGHSTMFMNYIVNPLGSVVMNFISNNQNNKKKLEEFVGFYNNFLLLVILPLQVLLYVYADFVINLLFGAQWIPATGLFKLFILRSLVELIFNPYSFFLTAFGRVDLRAKLNWFAVALLGGALFVTTRLSSDIFIYAVVFVICSLIISFIKSFLSIKVSKVNLREIFVKIKKTMMLSLLIIVMLFIPSSMTLIIKVLTSITLCLTFYVLVIIYDRKVIAEIDKKLLGCKFQNIYHKLKTLVNDKNKMG